MSRGLGWLRPVGAIAALAALGAGAVAPATAGEIRDRVPVQVFAHPVTPDRAVVAVAAGTRDDLTTAEVRDSSGEIIGRAVLRTTGKALVPLTLPRGSTQQVTVTLTNGTAARVSEVRTTLRLSTKAAALQRSPWRVVNKQTPLRAQDAPVATTKVQGVPLEPRAAHALKGLLTRAAQENVDFYPSNGYRAHGWQKGIYQSYVRADGAKNADRYSARPGFSEHQTGFAFDAKARNGKCDLKSCFGATPEGRFLTKHAGELGYLVRYTKTNRSTTGYSPEPWHLRYVGPWLTGYLHETSTTSLEDAFAMPAASSYRR